MDVLNIIAIFCNSQKEGFKRLRPSELNVSKNNGKFNRDYGISGDSRIGYFLLNN
jgi:hypothetical protein